MKTLKKSIYEGFRADSYSKKVFDVNIDDILPNRFQPRVRFDSNSIIRLADSIKKYGILQPISVRVSNEDPDLYEMIAGERRLRAAKLAGLYTVPCILIEADDVLSSELAIIENLLREDLNMFEQARSFERLIREHGLTQEEIAKRISMSQSAVANKLRLLRLGDKEQELILASELTERHARALLKLDDQKDRLDVILKASNYTLNVKDTETLIERMIANRSKISNINEKVLSSKDVETFIKYTKKKLEHFNSSGLNSNMSITEDDSCYLLTVRIDK